jgi:hypothetical protein
VPRDAVQHLGCDRQSVSNPNSCRRTLSTPTGCGGSSSTSARSNGTGCDGWNSDLTPVPSTKFTEAARERVRSARHHLSPAEVPRRGAAPRVRSRMGGQVPMATWTIRTTTMTAAITR